MLQACLRMLQACLCLLQACIWLFWLVQVVRNEQGEMEDDAVRVLVGQYVWNGSVRMFGGLLIQHKQFPNAGVQRLRYISCLKHTWTCFKHAWTCYWLDWIVQGLSLCRCQVSWLQILWKVQSTGLCLHYPWCCGRCKGIWPHQAWSWVCKADYSLQSVSSSQKTKQPRVLKLHTSEEEHWRSRNGLCTHVGRLCREHQSNLQTGPWR